MQYHEFRNGDISGADKVIDYTKEYFTKTGQIYDITFYTVGKASFSHYKSSLKQIPPSVMDFNDRQQKGMIAPTGLRPASERTKDLIFLKELIEVGKIKPVIDRRYPLEQIAEAPRYVEKGHKKRNVVITVEQNNKS